MRPILPHAKMLALSATLTVNGQGDVAKHLLMKCFRVISSAPMKENISLVVLQRPPLSSKVSSKETYNFVLQPVLQSLKSKGQHFPLTIIYLSEIMYWVGYAYACANKVLGGNMYASQPQFLENCRVAMYHSSIRNNDEVS